MPRKPRPKKLRRSESLVFFWEDGRLVCEDYLERRRFAVSPGVVELLDQFGAPKDATAAGAEHGTAIKLLSQRGLLRRAATKRERALRRWYWGPAARHFFFSTKAASTHLSLPRRREHARKLLKASRQPPRYKEYPRARRVPLPKGGASTSEAGRLLGSIRDVRRYERRPIPKSSLSEILFLACGEQGTIHEKPWGELSLKTYHSAGYRHPIEVYAVVVAVDGLAPGLYHYNAREHGLELLKRGDFSAEAKRIANSQTWVKNASVYLLLTAVPERTAFKYRHDSFLRSIFIDAGHISQSIYLAAGSLGLGACATHALRHDLAEQFLAIDGVSESFLHMLMVGCARKLPQAALISPYRRVTRS